MYVGVKHNPESTKLFWFSVPENITHRVMLGSRIICDTKKGSGEHGVVCQINNQVLDQEGIRALTNGRNLKSITGVECDVNLSDIKIPVKFARTTVHDDKIAKRLEEFESTGEFNTRVIVRASNNMLADGYSAYLAANRLGRNTIRCLVIK